MEGSTLQFHDDLNVLTGKDQQALVSLLSSQNKSCYSDGPDTALFSSWVPKSTIDMVCAPSFPKHNAVKNDNTKNTTNSHVDKEVTLESPQGAYCRAARLYKRTFDPGPQYEMI